ncbi:MAG TPA: hypothetical protein ENK18_02015 [Deltaproteobacteria bacterium]|nr:hypothetical protein [Deltaproteobacteria bacterium]
MLISMLASAVAHACSCAVVVTPTVLPGHGATVPANLPALWVGAGDNTEGWILMDARGRRLPAELRAPRGPTPSAHLEWHELVPGDPLQPGRTYRIRPVRPDGEAWETTFHTGPPAPLPRTLGTVVVGPLVEGPLQIKTLRSCSGTLDALQRIVVVHHTSEAAPWRELFVYNTLVDEQPWSPRTSLCTQPVTGGSWTGRGQDRVFATCGWSTALRPGAHTVRFEAHLPGQGPIYTDTATVPLHCSEERWPVVTEDRVDLGPVLGNPAPPPGK